ncbi:MAG: FAD-dependent oxidoreductase [bacterium]
MTLKRLMEPVTIGGMTLRNRIGMPPMTMAYASPADGVSQTDRDYFAERAKGGAALIMVGGVCVEGRIGKLMVPGPLHCLDRDEQIPGYAALADAVHAHGARMAVQLYHAGRQTSLDKTAGAQPVSSSAKETLFMGVVPMPSARALAVNEIEQIEDDFAEAARRAQAAGIDAVLIDGGAGYLIAQFMSPFVNKRTDAYGGSLEKRMRFPLRIVEKTRERVGSAYPLLFDLPADELVEGGIRIEESRVMARMLEEAGISAFRIHVALYETYQYVVPPAAVPRGVHAPLGRAIKESVREAKVMLGHRINDPLLAEKLLGEGAADFILMGRALIADPELPVKVEEDRLEDIRPCIACNIGCVGSIVAGVPATCTVNPMAGKEAEHRLVPAPRRKKVVVVGGGVGGMEAARVAALRGHEVILYEKSGRLGGWAAVGCLPPHKEEIRGLVDYFSAQLRKSGVRVELDREATVREILAGAPDAVVVATGSVASVPGIPGAAGDHVVQAADVLTGKAQTGSRVVVVGGGQTGLETAEFLAGKGKRVSVIEMLPEVGADMELITKVFMLPRLARAGVETRTSVRVEEITKQGVRAGGELFEADTVVLATGLKARDGLSEALKGKVPEVHVIGDCVKPRKLLDAIHEGARAGRTL